ncbi:MauE/DoxX family redox-associated membrane protein [Nonomuraea sp. NPDC049152]|uniref:MauE/DoxX family redox-associated membrane protein n=1 Tax=Nonomuraea sp. NPDC049152 TaxID=3154350 RepID=UPI0033D0B280
MPGLSSVVGSFVLAGALLLLVATWQRVATGSSLRRVVTGHGLLPRRVAGLVVVAEAVEPIAGLALVAGWLAGRGVLLSVASGIVAAWFAGLVGYLWVLMRKRGPVPCGCLDDTSPVSAAKIGRAAMIAAAGTVVASGLAVPAAEPLLRAVDLALGAFVAVAMVVTDRVFDVSGTSGGEARYE